MNNYYKNEDELLNTLISDSSLSNSVKSVLLYYDINTLKDLVSLSASSLKAYRGIGTKRFKEIEDYLLSLNLSFADPSIADLANVEHKNEELLNTLISESDLSDSLKNILTRNGANTIGDLMNTKVSKLIKQKDFKKHMVGDIIEYLSFLESKLLLKEKDSSERNHDILEVLIRHTDLSTGIKNVLINNGINTIGDLVDTPVSTLKTFKGFGVVKLNEIKEYLLSLNLNNIGDDSKTFNNEELVNIFEKHTKLLEKNKKNNPEARYYLYTVYLLKNSPDIIADEISLVNKELKDNKLNNIDESFENNIYKKIICDSALKFIEKNVPESGKYPKECNILPMGISYEAYESVYKTTNNFNSTIGSFVGNSDYLNKVYEINPNYVIELERLFKSYGYDIYDKVCSPDIIRKK